MREEDGGWDAVKRRFLWLLLSLVVGCTRDGHVVVFEERAGGIVADILTALNGGTPVDAVTLPDGTTVYLRHSDDPCLVAHEETHVMQVEREGLLLVPRYLAEHARVGYAGNRYEVEAREVQRQCEDAR